MTFLRVALDVPLFKLFTYRTGDADASNIGRRVVVPFGKKIALGLVMEVGQASDLPSEHVRSVLHVLRDAPAVPHDVLALLKFCSDYYHHPIGQVVFAALPTRLRRRRAVPPAARSRRYRLTDAGKALDRSAPPRLAKTNFAILELLGTHCDGVALETLKAFSPGAPVAIRRLAERGWVEELPDIGPPVPASRPLLRDAGGGPPLTPAQANALDGVRKTLGAFTASLLFGVTGSGKTEVYLRLMAEVLAAGGQVLLLAPEINLTPQLIGHVSARFPGARVVSLHSGLTESERLHNWLAAQSGDARIVLGTRLAVFAPLPDLAAIIVDEENDGSYKQLDGLRYSARDVALVRAKRRGIPVVLGSATPAIETYYKAQRGQYALHIMSERARGALPVIDCVDTRGETLVDGLSQTMLRAMHVTLERGDQCLIYINRRGYAPVIVCRDCCWMAGCQRCTAKLVLHASDAHLHCHHCGHRERARTSCPQCGNKDLLPIGQGTQRVEAALTRMFPSGRILRIDSDSTRHKDAWEMMRKRIHDRDVDILVGTQMLAKGHDFPQINLVGVLNADTSLYSTNFRASEHLFARLVQVAGRAGRGSQSGRVVVQTEFPQHPLYAALRRHDYPAFAAQLLDERRRAALPPFTYQAVLRAEAPRLESALKFLRDAVHAARSLAGGVTLYDPVPAQLRRLAGLERAQVVVEARARSALHSCLSRWAQELDTLAGRRVRWALDVDPLDF
jgi:primosomal protein N' (replication factor Y)